MAISYGFYNSLYKNNTYDKLYESGQMSKLFDGLIIDGVYVSKDKNDPNTQFMVTADTNDMNVKVGPGIAWFLGTYTILNTDLSLTVSPAHTTYDRIDAIVVEINTTREVRENDIKLIKGTAASTPQKPSMTHSGGVDQYPIAYVHVNKGVTVIRTYDVEYVVGTETPYFAWIGERFSIADLYSKWEEILGVDTMPFVAWFQSMYRMIGRGDSDYTNIVSEIGLVNSNAYIFGTLPKVNEQSALFSGDGASKSFEIVPASGTVNNIADILVDGERVYNYTFDSSTSTVTLENAPAVGTNNIVVYYVLAAETYTLYFSEEV